MNLNKKILEKVLVIDNDEVFCFIIHRMLRQEKRTENVVCVHSVEEALELLAKETFNVIITDLDMPILDGFDFLDGLMHLQQTRGFTIPPTYVLTSSEKESDKQKATSYPIVNGYFVKPFTKEYLDEIFSLQDV